MDTRPNCHLSSLFLNTPHFGGGKLFLVAFVRVNYRLSRSIESLFAIANSVLHVIVFCFNNNCVHDLDFDNKKLIVLNF